MDYYEDEAAPDCLSLNSEGFIELDQSKYKGNGLKASMILSPQFGSSKIIKIEVFDHYDYKEEAGQCKEMSGAQVSSLNEAAKNESECKTACTRDDTCYAYDFFGGCNLYSTPNHNGNGSPSFKCFLKIIEGVTEQASISLLRSSFIT